MFWYCHKRGREVRLEKERDLTEQEVEQLDQQYRATNPGQRLTTTAGPNASIEEIKAGIDEVEIARQAAVAAEAATSTETQPTQSTTGQTTS